MIISHMPTVALTDGPLEGCAVPLTMEDIALQMGSLVDTSDMALGHIEADRLLLLALELCTIHTDKNTIYEIIAHFNTIHKVYE